MSTRRSDLNSTVSRRGFLALGAGSSATSRQQRRMPGTSKALSDNDLVPPFAVRVLNRMGFGPRRWQVQGDSVPDPDAIFGDRFQRAETMGVDDIAYFESLGSTDDQRLQRYVDQQLDPNLEDPEWETRKARYPNSFATLDESLEVAFSTRECQGFSRYVQPYREVERAAFTRAVYGRRQLHELMTDFWHNHFNIFAGADRDTYASWASWDRDVIRHHAFGNFHDFLQATAKHPAMSRYLDNYANEAGGFNENYARELFELHSLGAINYMGTVRPSNVPALDTNPYAGLGDAALDLLGYSDPGREIQTHYTDDDVYAAARALTGWRYSDEDIRDDDNNCIYGGSGAFMVSESAHDGGSKAVLSRGFNLITSDGGAQADGEAVIKVAAYHPGTAQYIAYKLCQRLIADEPPESIVTLARDTFYANRTHPRQIALTLRAILLSAEFKDPANWGRKIKRPFEYVVSAMRAARCDYTWRYDDRTSDSFLRTYESAGQKLFWWRTPDGYPDARANWMGSTSMVQNWRCIDWLSDEHADDDNERVLRILDATLEHFPGNPTPRELVAFWCHWIMGYTPDGGWVGGPFTGFPNEPTALGRATMQFITQEGYGIDGRDGDPYGADEPIPRDEIRDNSWPRRWHVRLRGMVQLILWSPAFMQR